MIRLRKNVPDFYRAYGRVKMRIQFSFTKDFEEIMIGRTLQTEMKIIRTIQAIIDSFWCILYPKQVKKNYEIYIKEKVANIVNQVLKIITR